MSEKNILTQEKN